MIALPPGLLFKITVALAIASAAAIVAWEVKGAFADRELSNAVQAAKDEAQKELDAERQRRAYFEILADTKFEAFLKSISSIKEDYKKISQSIAKERELHREFYNQPLPPGGYSEWKRSRELVSPSGTASGPQ